MRLITVKEILKTLEVLDFQLPNGEFVPSHFHVTEVGKISKAFIDCGGTLRKESVVNFQLWNANDFDHKLSPEKLIGIIELSEKVLGIDLNQEVEVEYQGASIEKYGLDFDGQNFQLKVKLTDCLAPNKCGISFASEKPKENTISECCTPNSGCC